MKRFIAFILLVLTCSVAGAQAPTSLTRAINLLTVTSGQVLSDTTAKLIIDGTNIGTRGISLTNLGTAVLSTQSLVNSLTIKGNLGGTLSNSNGIGTLTLTVNGVPSILTGTSTITGAITYTLTGGNVFTLTSAGSTLTLAQTTTGALTLSNLGVGSISATNAAAIVLNTTLSGREGLRIVSQTGQTANLLTVQSITTGTSLLEIQSDGMLWIRNNSSVLQQWGTPGVSRVSVMSAPSLATYFNFGGGVGIGFNPTAGAQGQDGNTACISSTTNSILQVTNTNGTRVGVSAGSVFTGFSSVSANTSMTIANTAINLNGAVTVTLPDGTAGPAGRMVFMRNIGGATGTAAGLTSTQTIDGSATQGILSGSSAIYIYNGTSWNKFSN